MVEEDRSAEGKSTGEVDGVAEEDTTRSVAAELIIGEGSTAVAI